MDRAEFTGQFFGRAADDPVAMGLRTAALTARLSGRQDALRDAAEHLADAMQTVGLDRLPRFLDDAEARANDPSTRTALEKSRQTLAQRDAIRPVYPLETALGIAVVGGAVGVAPAAVGAVVRQLLSKRPTITSERPQTQPSGKPSESPRPSPKEKPPEPPQPLPKARVSPGRRTHILDGDPGEEAVTGLVAGSKIRANFPLVGQTTRSSLKSRTSLTILPPPVLCSRTGGLEWREAETASTFVSLSTRIA